jgi:hypothetical protein
MDIMAVTAIEMDICTGCFQGAVMDEHGALVE